MLNFCDIHSHMSALQYLHSKSLRLSGSGLGPWECIWVLQYEMFMTICERKVRRHFGEGGSTFSSKLRSMVPSRVRILFDTSSCGRVICECEMSTTHTAAARPETDTGTHERKTDTRTPIQYTIEDSHNTNPSSMLS